MAKPKDEVGVGAEVEVVGDLLNRHVAGFEGLLGEIQSAAVPEFPHHQLELPEEKLIEAREAEPGDLLRPFRWKGLVNRGLVHWFVRLLLTPGGFARVRGALGAVAPALLVPDAAIPNDPISHIVLTVDADNTVVAKTVELSDLHNGLRVIRSGPAPTDRVIIQGVLYARPGAKVAPSVGTIQEKAEQATDAKL